jgi:hypothetical protein
MSRRALWPALAAALAAFGCGDPYGFRDYQPDAVPTAMSGSVLAGYDGEPPARPAPPERPARVLPAPRPPKVELPGPPERPWAGPPRTLPYPGTGQPAATPSEAAPGTAPVPGGLAALDRVEVRVDGHPEFSGSWRVAADGLLAIPEGGAFGPELLSAGEFARGVGPVVNSRPEEVAGRIARLLRPFVKKPPAVKLTVPGRKEG